MYTVHLASILYILNANFLGKMLKMLKMYKNTRRGK